MCLPMGYCWNKGTRKNKNPLGIITSRPNTSTLVLCLLYPLAKIIAAHFCQTNHEIYDKVMQIRADYRIWSDLPFTSVFINYPKEGDGCLPHIDKQDLFCSIYTIGAFIGGQLANLKKKEVIFMKNNSFISFESAEDTHGSYPLTAGFHNYCFCVQKLFKGLWCCNYTYL